MQFKKDSYVKIIGNRDNRKGVVIGNKGKVIEHPGGYIVQIELISTKEWISMHEIDLEEIGEEELDFNTILLGKLSKIIKLLERR